MKKLNIPQIEACLQCPYAAIAQFSVDAYFQYCSCKYFHASKSALEMMQAMAECAIEDMMSVPDWCPLPDADETQKSKSAPELPTATPKHLRTGGL